MSAPTVLMAVFNGLEFDGRVQRAASALAPIAAVHVIGLSGEGPVWAPPDGAYTTEGVPGPMMGVGAQRAFGRRLRAVAAALRPALVYAHDYYAAWPGRVAARKAGARFVYDAHELLQPLPGQKRTLRERLFERLERMGAAGADLVICANEPRARMFQAYHGLPHLPLVVRNIPDDRGDTVPEGIEQDPHAVLYQGDMGYGRRLERLVDAMGTLDEGTTLWMVGGGPALDKLRAMAAARGVEDRVRFPGRVPRGELGALMASCGVGVLSYPAPDLNNVYCAPNKVYEYARAGLPMVAIGSDHLKELVEEPGLGVALDADASPEAIAKAVSDVSADRERHAAACEAFALDNPWESEADRLRAAIRPLLVEGGSDRG